MNKSLTHGIAYLLVCALVHPPLALAQTTDIAPSASTAAAQAEPTFKQEELDQMLAPVALYPDALLSQMLMASTYPLEVVEAARWVKQHTGFSGAALQDALAGQPWDASVKSLCAFPQILNRMSRDLSWTQQLGDAFIDQQQQVMDSVQTLRQKAQAAGTLKSNAQQQVVVADDEITIEPANPQVVYVPTYDPTVVYGSWWWPGYPPYYPAYWGTPPGAVLANGFFWGVGIGAGLALWGGFNWHRHDVNINVSRYNYFNRTHFAEHHWQFDPAHRGGVPYRSISAHQRYGGFDQHAAQAREHFQSRGGSFGPVTRHEAPNVGRGAQARGSSSRGNASMGSGFHGVGSGGFHGGGGGHGGGHR